MALEVPRGYYDPPELYLSAIQRVDRALQVRIQELILKDAILDQDQPVPEQYRKHVEEYYQGAVGGLEITPCRRFNGCLRTLIAVYLACLARGCSAALWLARRWATSPLARNPLLLVLRAIVLSLLILILLNPVRRSEIRLPPQPAEIVFLVDCSKSMGLSRPGNRLEQVKEVLRQCNLPGSSVRASVFRFGRQLSAVSTLDELAADDDATLLLDALERLPARFGRRSAGRRGCIFRRAHYRNLRLSERRPKAIVKGRRPCTSFR